jgi:FkbH-like protein
MVIDGEFSRMSGRMAKDTLDKLLKNIINTPSDYAKISREIEKRNSFNRINISYLASYTSEVLKPYIVVELAKKGYKGSLYFAPFNQFEQEIHNSDSGLYLSNPDVVILHNRIEDNHQDLVSRFAKYSESDLNSLADNIIQRHKLMIETLRSKSDTKIIVMNFGNLQMTEDFFTSSSIIQSQWVYIQKLNNRLLELCNKIPSCYVVNYQQIFNGIGLNNCIDPKLFYMARIPFNSNAQISFGKIISRTIAATYCSPAKCIVLDLDNTLWGGVIGEDGISGIQISDEYPGNVFKDFQRALLGLRDQGVLLSIASKNNLDDVLEVFERHTDCLLKKNDFSSMQINWEDKASSIKKISKELNIGLDSIVFFDDNPVERDWVRKQLPNVKVIDVPKNSMDYLKALNESTFFDRLTITNEDKSRADIYQREQQKKIDLNKSVSVDDFLKDLKMTVNIGFSNDITITRIVQLLNKTNQFNLTTKRYSSADVTKIILNGGKVLWLSAADRYGDNGIVGVSILVKIKEKDWLIDSMLLSCRVIGRKIETVFLAEIIEILRSENANVVYGQYLPTKKNSIVSDFYNQNSFQLTDKKNNLWEFNLNESYLIKPNYIEVSINND